MSKNSLCLLITIVLRCSVSFTQATDVYYMRADIDEPWCCGWAPYADSNPLTLDAVFGPGFWSMAFYEYCDPYSIFNDNTCYVFMEGGESHTDYMEEFFTANQSLIEQWVYNGGSLFMNAAPNVGDGLSCGFGDVWLWYPYAWPGDVMNGPDALTHPIWNGPFTPLATEMWGPSYAHAYVTGSDLTPLIVDTYTPDEWVLSEKAWGMGHLFFGGMTTASWHWPNTECVNIRQNMHSYMYLMCGLLLSDGLTEFTAEAMNESAALRWNMQNLPQNGYFELARSQNGSDWETFAQINAESANSYSFNDENPIAGKSYYRLSVVAEDGVTKESKIASFNAPVNFEIYPLPAHDHFVVVADEAESQIYTLMNLSGYPVKMDEHTRIGEVLFRFSGLEPGLYLLQAENKRFKTIRQIVIE